THALQYFAAITPGINYTIGELDGEQFVYYGSNVIAVIPKTEWIKKIDADEQDYWKSAKDRMSGELDNLQHLLTLAVKHFNHTEDSKDLSTDEKSPRSHALVGVVFGAVVLFVLMLIYRYNNNS
ncbi:H-2 class I histocompatibility antigen, Q10 alpha chain-like isoform X2, partial [Clarias magur]